MTLDEDHSTSTAGRVAGIGRSVLSALVGSKLRIAGLVLGSVVLLVGAGFALGVLGAPEVAGLDNTFGAVDENTTVVESNLTVSNPNPFGASLSGLVADYTIEMNGIEMAFGTKEGISIGSGTSTIPLETELNNSAIPAWWASHVDGGERTDLLIDATITSSTLGRSTTIPQERTIETDLIGQFDSEETRPVGTHPLTGDPVLYIEETGATWGTVTAEETPIDMTFLVYNPNPEAYTVTELRYEVTMNDIVVGEGATEEPYVIPGESRETFEATTAIRNQRLDEWWVSHLNESVHGHQVSEFRIEFEAVVELPTGDRIVVPLDELTHEEFVGTDIFDEGGEVGVPPDESPDDGDGSDGDDSDGSDTDGDADGDDTGDDTDGTDDGSDGDDGDDDGLTDGTL